MLRLTRRVRFALLPGADAAAQRAAAQAPAANSYAGHPSMEGFGRHYEVDIACERAPDPRTGYSVDIRAIDRAVRLSVAPLMAERIASNALMSPAALLPELAQAAQQALDARVASLSLWLTPTHCLSLETHDMTTILLRQRFDFAAAHRLHVPEWPEERNREVFGKCNNPSGHGHNYGFEPVVEASLDASGRAPFTLRDLERVTDETIIERFDHKHLNQDCPEFAELNPSVEHIAKVAFDLLAPAIAAQGASARLRSVTVWETEKTSCVYPGEPISGA